MGDIGISYNQEQDADLTRERPSDHILSQLALATIMLSLEVDLLAFVRAVNAADADAAGVYVQTRAETLHAMSLFARNLHQTGQLQVSANEARDLLWTYFSAEVYELLVLERGWSTKRYGRFLADAVIAALVEPG